MKTFSVGIIGASGYTGAELLRLLSQHPVFTVQVATAYSESGKALTDLYPHLGCYSNLQLTSFEGSLADLNRCDLVFSGLPHGALMPLADQITGRLVDLSSDFRLKRPEEYLRWYKKEHTAPASLSSWQYGLPELFREAVASSTRVANPGCFATAVSLALAPAVAAGLIEGDVVVDAVSGTSGAGKKPSDLLHFSHSDENVVAYKVGEHQHIGEIEQCLGMLSSAQHKISMTTHLVPMSRGIHAACSSRAISTLSQKELTDRYRDFFKDEPFITVSDTSPHTKYVRGANTVMLYPHLDERTSRVIVTSVIDNLVKGAAGQAIQNANLMCGLAETTGLPKAGLYP